MKTMLKTEGLNKEYQLGGFPHNVSIKALHNINITVESDEPVIISVVGESGSGKTTLAKVILRLVQPSSGAVTVADHLAAGTRARRDKTEFLRTVHPIFQHPFVAVRRY